MADIRIGFAGWTFPPWRGTFYPDDLVQRRELEFASRQVNSLEINGTFYSLQKPETFQRWYRETPDDFRFAVKAPQFITHVLRLKEAGEPLRNFLASGLLCLKEKLGPILWQFPPNVKLKDDRFEKFLKLLPHDSQHAAELARAHGKKVEGRAWTEPGGDYPVRHAMEFRHPSFQNADFIALLRAHRVAVVFAHSGKKTQPYMEDLTADFIYARLHGEAKEFSKGYTGEAIRWWAKRILTWTSGRQPKDSQCASPQKPAVQPRDAFVYFDNRAKVKAPVNAVELLEKLAPEVQGKRSA